MDTLDPGIIDLLTGSATTTAALVGAILLVILVVLRRGLLSKLEEKWETLTVKIFAVVAAVGNGLIAVETDSWQTILKPILSGLILVGLSVGLYKAIGDRIWPKKDSDE